MDNALKMNRSRLLEAIDYIDPRFVEETKIFYRNLPDSPSGEPNKKTAWLSLRRFAALAACLLLVGALIPIAHYVAVNFDAFIPSGIEGTTSTDTITETDNSENIDSNVENSSNVTTECNYIIVLTSSPISLSIEEVNEILNAYIDKYYSCDNSNIPGFKYEYSFRCYGKFNDVYAGFVDVEGALNADVITKESVNGFDFIYPSTKKMLIYYKGNFYSLTDAFEQAIIDSESIEMIYRTYNENR